MRATPSLRCLARTMTRPPSSSVMCAVSSRVPSAIPTRSAPSSRALAIISVAVSGFRNISTAFLLLPFELLQLSRHDALVAFRSNPARVPVGKAGNRLTLFAGGAPALLNFVLLRRALGDVLLHVGKMRVIVVADRTHCEATRAG